jgi:hypothetical protein
LKIFELETEISLDSSLKAKSDIMKALSKLNINWENHIPFEIKKIIEFQLLNGTLKNSSDAHYLSSIINSLARMYTKDINNSRSGDVLQYNIENSIVSSVLQNVNTMDSTDTAKIFWSLGNIGFQFHPQELIRPILIRKFHQTILNMTQREIIWSICSISKVGIQYDDFDKDLQDRIHEVSSRIISSCESGTDIGMILWALGRIKTPINDFSVDVKELLFTKIDTYIKKGIVDEQESLKTLRQKNRKQKSSGSKNRTKISKDLSQNLGSVGIMWSDIPEETKVNLVSTII